MDEKELLKINSSTEILKNNFAVNEKYTDSVWKANYESDLLKKYKDIYFDIYSIYPNEEIGHGSSECSAIKKRIDGLDIISIGADLEKFHTTEETTFINSWVKIYTLLLKLLEKI